MSKIFIDPWKAKVIEEEAKKKVALDKELRATNPSTLGIDDILKCQLSGLDRLSRTIVEQITAGQVTKDTAQQLAVCIRVTMELKEKENEILDKLSDEELENLADEKL